MLPIRLGRGPFPGICWFGGIFGGAGVDCMLTCLMAQHASCMLCYMHAVTCSAVPASSTGVVQVSMLTTALYMHAECYFMHSYVTGSMLASRLLKILQILQNEF